MVACTRSSRLVLMRKSVIMIAQRVFSEDQNPDKMSIAFSFMYRPRPAGLRRLGIPGIAFEDSFDLRPYTVRPLYSEWPPVCPDKDQGEIRKQGDCLLLCEMVGRYPVTFQAGVRFNLLPGSSPHIPAGKFAKDYKAALSDDPGRLCRYYPPGWFQGVPENVDQEDGIKSTRPERETAGIAAHVCHACAPAFQAGRDGQG